MKFQNTDPSTRQTLGTQRIENLVDGVFSIVLTLLVLDIQVPSAASEMDLLGKLWGLREHILSFVISFVVLGTFWYGHTIEFHFIQRSDRIHIGLSLLFLLCIAFIPFSASLIGEDGQFRFAGVVYGLNLLFTAIMRYWHWYYATNGHRLIDPATDPRFILKLRQRFLMVPFACIFAILVSLFNTRIGFLLYVLIPVFYLYRVRGSGIPTSATPQTSDID
ncbi:DUF1211 domain-containing protein [Cyanobacteria bacterium FACHB-63]|nr:DUF1211 domain-containing protein [Cyanobacteria bacterium FACHB-63]